MPLSYDVVPIDPLDASWASQVSGVVSSAFGRPFTAERIVESTFTETFPQRSVFVAAIERNEVIGFNAFMCHSVVHRGSVLEAYQSCWSAVSPEHRGKKVFVNIIREALR